MVVVVVPLLVVVVVPVLLLLRLVHMAVDMVHMAGEHDWCTRTWLVHTAVDVGSWAG